MTFLSNVRMRNKLVLLLIVPLAGLLYFSIQGIFEKIKSSGEMDTLENLSGLAVKISELVHETQKERGASSLFLGANGAKFASELQMQMANTDKKKVELKEFLSGFNVEQFGSEIKRTLESALSYLEMLGVKRDAINSLNISVEEEIGYYTKMNGALLNTISRLSTLCTNPEISTEMFAYVNLLQMKEHAGQERAVMSNTFAADLFGPGMLNKFIALAAEQDVYADVFLSFASPEQRDLYKNKLAGQFVDETSRMRTVALEKAGEGKFGVDPTYWFKMQTGKIDLLKDVENGLSNDLRLKSRKLKEDAKSAFILFILITVFTVVPALVIAGLIAQGITHPLNVVVNSLNRLARGDTSVKINVDFTDEIGQLLKAMNNMMLSINTMAEAASSIASGDLTVKVVPQSEKDVLGNGLTNMIKNLRRQASEIAEGVSVLASSASEISATTAQLASGTEQTSIAVAETTTTVEEVKQTANVSSQKAKRVSELAQSAVQISQNGAKLVKETIDGINRIREQMEYIAETIVQQSEHNQAIGEIIATVDDLAEQSNLLSVNAAIEAAKVGEQGKGFIVVAQEIKNLAEQSKQATKQVRSILSNIQKASTTAVMATEKGSKAVEVTVKQSAETGDSIQELTRSIAEASQAVTQIAASNQQQLVGMDQVAIAMTNIKQATAQNAASTKQVETTVRSLQELGQKLKEMIERYKV